MKEQELQWIASAKQGNQEAFDQLYNSYYHLVFYYAWNLSHNEADAKDITQETFLQVYKSLPTLRDDTLFLAWIRKITLSKSQLLFRKNKEKVYEMEQISKQAGREKRSAFIPHQYLNNLSDREILEGLMLRLPEKRREVMELFYFEQRSIEEIAQILNINKGTVKSRLHHARIALKEEVERFEKEEDRKLSFQVDTLFTGVSFGILAHLYALRKVDSIKQMYTILQITTISVCAVTGVYAISETYDTIQEKQKPQKEIVQKIDDSVIFQSIPYRDKIVSSTNDAYFILMQFAADKELLEGKSKEELQEIQPIVEELCKSDNAYKERLQQDGWIETFEFLTNL